jgi:RHH-type proline utilization regulon transcriptional repressor/proline dehydrogenase/delta 1-pyrroline-5-carboxylate dehydrogenase
MDNSPAGYATTLIGPTGERNDYRLKPRQAVLCLASNPTDLLYQLATVLAVDGQALWIASPALAPLYLQLPPAMQAHVQVIADMSELPWDAVLMHGSTTDIIEMNEYLAERPGPIITMQALPMGWRQPGALSLTALLKEQSVSVNTAAAGGNASLMTLA